MLIAEATVNRLYASLSKQEVEAFEKATGVKESCVYDGPEGKIHKEEMLGGIQYHVAHKTKRKYFGSQRSAMNFIKKRHAAKQNTGA